MRCIRVSIGTTVVLLLLLALHAWLLAPETPQPRISDKQLAGRLVESIREKLQRLGPIPRVVHVVWERRLDVHTSSVPMIREGVQRLLAVNPDWKLHLAERHEIDEYFRMHLPLVTYWQLRSVHQVERTNLYRHLVLCHDGGMYVDIDRLANRKLSKVLRNNTKMLIATYRGLTSNGGAFSQDLLCSAPQNPLHCGAVDAHIAHRARCANPFTKLWPPGSCVHFASGSPLTMATYSKMLFGNPLPNRGYLDKQTRTLILQLLHKLRPLATIWDERPPLDTALHHPKRLLNSSTITSDATYLQAKQSFYESEHVTHWALLPSHCYYLRNTFLFWLLGCLDTSEIATR